MQTPPFAHTVPVEFSLLLVHSPLVGPSTWSRMAEAASSRGITVVVADISPGLASRAPMWSEMVRIAAAAGGLLPGPVDVVAHSGAGALLPGIGAALGRRRRRLLFVDAILPPAEGAHRYPPAIQRRIEEIGSEDTLPGWLDWFPTETVEGLLPEAADRELVASDLPAVPKAWFYEEVPVPAGWTKWRCGYLRLSAAYDDELTRARDLGWPAQSVDSHHLGIFTDPEPVLEAILGLGV